MGLAGCQPGKWHPFFDWKIDRDSYRKDGRLPKAGSNLTFLRWVIVTASR